MALVVGDRGARLSWLVKDHAAMCDELDPVSRDPVLEGRFGKDRSIFLGDDEHGKAPEVAAITLDTGDLLVFHAMKLRRKYRHQYTEAVPHRRLT